MTFVAHDFQCAQTCSFRAISGLPVRSLAPKKFFPHVDIIAQTAFMDVLSALTCYTMIQCNTETDIYCAFCIYSFSLRLNKRLHVYGFQERDCSRTLRSSAIPLLVQPFIKTDFSRRAFRFLAPTVWNSLPETILSGECLSVLNLDLKLYSLRLSLNTDPTCRQRL